jgi:uracil-DNA glycosylase family 4
MDVSSYDSTRSSQFEILSRKIKNCRRCTGLNLRGITESAPGYGNIFSRVALVGQSLCGPCMATQVPFTGGCGRLIDSALRIAGVNKNEIFITNVVHCHTPQNRKSLPHEIENCREYLMEELEIVRPNAVVALGQDATTSLLGESSWPSMIGAQVRKNSTIYPLYHPAFVLRCGPLKAAKYVETLANILSIETSGVPLQQRQWPSSCP